MEMGCAHRRRGFQAGRRQVLNESLTERQGRNVPWSGAPDRPWTGWSSTLHRSLALLRRTGGLRSLELRSRGRRLCAAQGEQYGKRGTLTEIGRLPARGRV